MHNLHKQAVLNGTNEQGADALDTENSAPGINLGSFQWQSVDEKFEKQAPETARLLAVAPTTNPPLGVLSHFKGTFVGTGMNLIFRPSDGSFQFTNPVEGATPPKAPNENILQINLTNETLTFATPLGQVPNRGLQDQKDIFLNGVPYTQVITDATNPATGKADAPTPQPGIHFEPGVWMHVPATADDPAGIAQSLTRMASIPHGTTINAQCIMPTTAHTGPPDFTLPQNQVDITPFFINGGQQGPNNPLNGVFKSQTASDPNTSRIPQDLSKFIQEGTITQEFLTNPNNVLANAIKGQNITNTIFFEVDTNPQAPLLGGGTDNIAFLQGTGAFNAAAQTGGGPNASAVSMSAKFWIETVEHQVTIPATQGNQKPLRLRPDSVAPGVHAPTFVVHPPAQHVTEAKTVNVTSTQIQYSQVVALNFATITWPHVSVATLVQQEQNVLHPGA